MNTHQMVNQDHKKSNKIQLKIQSNSRSLKLYPISNLIINLKSTYTSKYRLNQFLIPNLNSNITPNPNITIPISRD